MPRIRTIKPQFFTDETIAELPAIARVLFIGLWTIADRSGRLEDRPRRIKVEVLPYDNEDVDALLKLLADSQFIVRYEVEGSKYIQIRTFEQHQVCHPREVKSRIPAPPLSRQYPASDKPMPGLCPANQEGKEISVEQEGKEREGAFAPASAAEAASASSPESAPGEPDQETPKRTEKAAKPRKPPQLVDDAFLESLQSDPTYGVFDIRWVAGKMLNWCKRNGKQPTQGRLMAWLNKEDRPLNGINQANQQKAGDAEFEFQAPVRL